jgi:hypothetical protein
MMCEVSMLARTLHQSQTKPKPNQTTKPLTAVLTDQAQAESEGKTQWENL